jgi:SDR family mycofactocin-dependent oxidoreductase
MTGRLDGKVAFITGAARGQGRAHAVRFAEEGADIVAFDLCDQMDSVPYPLASPEDLEETVNLVEKTGRRIVAEQGDVRNLSRLKSAVTNGVAAFGRLDFVLANAGILPVSRANDDGVKLYVDAIDVLLNGVYYTVQAALPALVEHGDGGAIVITSSTAGLNGLCPGYDEMFHGFAGYHAAKHGVVGLMRYFAKALAPKKIRVNTVHPTGVATPMLLNEYAEQYFAESPQMLSAFANLLPVQLIDASDVSEAMLYLCAESGRYITGITLPVDAGLTVK